MSAVRGEPLEILEMLEMMARPAENDGGVPCA